MFERNDDITAMVETLYDLCLPLNRGDVLTRETIANVVGVDPNTEHWQHVVNMVRRRVEKERHISMMPEREIGFRLLTITDQIALSEYRQRRAARQIRRGERSLKALDGVKGLTMHQKRLRLASLDGLRKSRLKIGQEIRITRAIAAPTPTLPRMKLATL